MDAVAEHIRTFDDLDFHVFSDKPGASFRRVMRTTSSSIGPTGIR